MAHHRQAIRESIRDALSVIPDVSVFETRVVPKRLSQLPSLSVYTLQESIDMARSLASAPRELFRELELVIEGWCAPGENVDDAMDMLAQSVENAMHADPFFGGVVADSILDSTSMEVDEGGQQLLGWVVMTYRITYFTDAPAAPDDLDDFVTAGATHNLGNEVHEDNQAEDVFTVQESP